MELLKTPSFFESHMLKDTQSLVHGFLLGAHYSDSGNYGCALTTKLEVEEGDDISPKTTSLVVIGR